MNTFPLAAPSISFISTTQNSYKMFFQNVTHCLLDSAKLFLSCCYSASESLCHNSLYFLCVLCVSVVKTHLHFRRITPSVPQPHCQYWQAADIREPSAALAPFQRIEPNQPPCKNVNSADTRELPACHFSGKYAKFAKGTL